MFVANLVFGVANAMAGVKTRDTAGALCGADPSSAAFKFAQQGLFFGAKYTMICYEIFIVAVSVRSLQTGSTSLPRAHEVVAHVVCATVGAGVFVGYTLPQIALAKRATAAYAAAYPSYPSYTFSAPDAARGSALERDISATDANYLRSWLVFFAMLLLLYAYQRKLLHRILHDWDDRLAAAEAEWDRELWDKENPHTQALRKSKRLLLDKQLEAYREVAKPLEPL